MPEDGRHRVVIENVRPEIDNGKFPIKRIREEKVTVQADVFADGHDKIHSVLKFRKSGKEKWNFVSMEPLVNDRWEGSFQVTELGEYEYTVEAWIDKFRTWQEDLKKKYDAGQKISVDLQIGMELIKAAKKRATGQDADELASLGKSLRNEENWQEAVSQATDVKATELMEKYPDQRLSTIYPRELKVSVERERALFSTWYEMFPRSTGDGTTHGTFEDAIKLLPDIAEMGFNVLYLPPIHPIGKTHRKGKNNAVTAGKDDPGSPWAIGAEAGGHKSVHPELGSDEDFEQFVTEAKTYGLDVALDIAFQCSPDHPWVKKYPEWFKWRPDGSVQYAENPPKKYEDILPINFETSDWQNLWDELYSVFDHWAQKGVRIFRVDNPHTKPFEFWQWVIGKLKSEYPGMIFLAEAFTRPKIMYRLAKAGFTQSYTYFTWRNTKREFTDYITELYRSNIREYFRPNFWPNTPDILPESLQYGGRPAFITRLVLAATLSSNYGIYGPAYELCVNDTLEGKEEYKDSEKYEIKDWKRTQEGNISDLVTKVNEIRSEHPALQQNWNLQFYDMSNEHILSYGKYNDDLSDMIFVAVNLDPYHTREGKVILPLEDLHIPEDQAYMVHELLTDTKMIWQGEDNYIDIDPDESPVKIYQIRRRLRRENDFDYFM